MEAIFMMGKQDQEYLSILILSVSSPDSPKRNTKQTFLLFEKKDANFRKPFGGRGIPQNLSLKIPQIKQKI